MKFSFLKSERAFKRRYFVRALRAGNFVVAKAARIAGLNRTHFYNMMKRHKITPVEIPMRDVHRVRPYETEHFEFCRRFLLRLLVRSHGSVSGAARLGGIDRTHIYRMARRFGVGLLPQGKRGNRGNAAWRALADHAEANEAAARTP